MGKFLDTKHVAPAGDRAGPADGDVSLPPDLHVGILVALTDRAAVVALNDAQPRLVEVEHAAVQVTAPDIGRQVVLQPLSNPVAGAKTNAWFLLGKLEQHIERDDESFNIELRRDLVIRCGKASVTMTRTGKVLIEGEYLVTDAAGTNRIRGASVEIN